MSSMYLEHFGANRNPFSATPDPRFLFLTSKHREALAALLFAVTERKGFMVLTGDAGTGKTTLIRKLLLSIPGTCAQFSVMVNPMLTRSELLETVLMDFGEKQIPESKPKRLEILRRRLLTAQAEARTSVLVIDEAHLLTEELMEEVRLLSNFETAEQKLLQIVLAGQSELERVLNLDSLRQVRQRVAIRMQIDPLEENEVRRYLQSRWSKASECALPFSEDSITLMARAARGIPRVINMVADAALVNAYGGGLKTIGKREVEEVLRDLGIGPTVVMTCPAPAAELPRLTAEPVFVSPARAGAARIERYEPSGKRARRWKIGSWFGMASGSAK